MTNQELNSYIRHYIEQDKTRSAIMLTAPWGTGKSHYIQNELIPYLSKVENGPRACIVISLYGLKSLSEISKAIFFECKAKFLRNPSNKVAAGLFAVRTVIKGVASFVGVDITKSEEEMKNLYESLDLSDKLIVLEDLERSEISIIEILGYVNNLVEQDGVKVLLVANEDELLSYQKSEPDKNGNTQIILDENTRSYLRVKEKTVNDTICFSGNIENAIIGILKSFENDTINSLLNEVGTTNKPLVVSNIMKIMNDVNNSNLRSVIFGCQKAVDIFQKATSEYDRNFLILILCGSVAFSLRWKNNSDSVSESISNYRSTLGTNEFPLLRSMYDYMVFQKIDLDVLNAEYRAYCSQIKFEKAQAQIRDKLNVVYSYYDQFESTIMDALTSIADNLEKTNDISPHEFGKLANYLVAIRHILECDEIVEHCRKCMIDRLQTLLYDDQIEISISFHSGIEFDNVEQKNELSNWEQEMMGAILSSQTDLLNIDYKPESIEMLYNSAPEKRDTYMKIGQFASLLDIHKTVELIKVSTPKQIALLRKSFLAVYNFSNIGEFFERDINALIMLKKEIDSLIEQKTINDRIVMMQLRYFSGNIASILSRMGINEID